MSYSAADPLARAIAAVLTPDLLKPGYGPKAHCYVASEAYFHLRGGKAAGFKPMTQRHEGGTHWWILGPNREIIDITAGQFSSPVPYVAARGCGFQTAAPSARARVVIGRVSTRYPELVPARFKTI